MPRHQLSIVEKSKVKTEISSSCEERNFLLKDKKEERKKRRFRRKKIQLKKKFYKFLKFENPKTSFGFRHFLSSAVLGSGNVPHPPLEVGVGVGLEVDVIKLFHLSLTIRGSQ